MMTASSTAFINALFDQSGGFIQDLLPFFYLALSLFIACLVIGFVYKAINGGFRKFFK